MARLLTKIVWWLIIYLSIELTQAAFDLFEQMLPERWQQIVECMSSLTQEEQHHLRALLQKIERGLAAQGTS